MIQIFWFTLWIATIVVCISYLKTREKLSLNARNTFEKWLMFSIIILLLINIGVLICEKRETTMEMNDCIRFYRYFPNFYQDSEFYFINEWCYEYFDEDEIQRLRASGRVWRLKEAAFGDLNLNKLLQEQE